MLYNKTRKIVICEKVKVADAFTDRLKGLLGSSKISDKFALVINSCNQVHMFFMRYPIGAIFLDKNMKILHKEHLKPWQVSKKIPNARCVVEVHPSILAHIAVGETLYF